MPGMFRRRIEPVYQAPVPEPATEDRWIDRSFVLDLLDELCKDLHECGADRAADMVLDARLIVRPARPVLAIPGPEGGS